MVEIHKPDTPNESTEAVNVYRTLAACPDNGCHGTMVADGYQKPLLTPLGPDAGGRQMMRHICSVCRSPAWFTVAYPRIHYVPASIPIEGQMRILMKERNAKD